MADFDFRAVSLREVADLVRQGEASCRDLTAHALNRIDEVNPIINAFVAVDADAAMAAAAGLDDRIAAGDDPGPLTGVPIGVKDLEDAAGFVTTKGSAVYAGQPRAERDSILVQRLRAAGCVVLGKTNTPELGWKGDTVNDIFGATRNPWNTDRSPGGSSGGAAAALAAGMVPLATGSDGGGSIRIPSACCGLSGLKPSLGRVPSAVAPNWLHLSTSGPMTRTAADLTLALDAVIGPDPADLRSLPMPEPTWSAALKEPHMPSKVAWSPTLGYATLDDEVRRICEAAVERLASELRIEVVEVPCVFPEDPAMAWVTMTNAYNARTLESYRGTELWEQIDPGLRQSVEFGSAGRAVDLVRAEDTCYALNIRLYELFHDVRLLITPTTAGVAPLSGEMGVVNGESTPNWVAFTYPFNLTRSPAGSVSAGLAECGVPVGLQFVGPQHGDLVVLRAMAAAEAVLDPGRLPPL